MAGKKNGPSQRDIRASLEQQLRDKGADVLHFQALLDDYMFFYSMLKKMKSDIRKRGLEIEATSSTGKTYTKENPSVKQAAMYSQRMMAILKDLGLTTESCRPPEDSGGDLG